MKFKDRAARVWQARIPFLLITYGSFFLNLAGNLSTKITYPDIQLWTLRTEATPQIHPPTPHVTFYTNMTLLLHCLHYLISHSCKTRGRNFLKNPSTLQWKSDSRSPKILNTSLQNSHLVFQPILGCWIMILTQF